MRNTPGLWPRLTLRKRIGGVVFEVDWEIESLAPPMLFGRYEPLTVRALRALLRKGDTVLDVGANVGYLTAIAADAVGPGGPVHCFEPVPKHFRKLQRLAALNPTYVIVPNQVAVGECEGTALIRTSITNPGGSTLVPNLRDPADVEEEIAVPIIRLDAYIRQAGLRKISLIKIDVEGFEFPVLRGLQEFFETAWARPVIIAEILPAAYPLLGCTVTDVSRYMRNYHYRAYALDAIGKEEVDLAAVGTATEVVFVAD